MAFRHAARAFSEHTPHEAHFNELKMCATRAACRALKAQEKLRLGSGEMNVDLV